MWVCDYVLQGQTGTAGQNFQILFITGLLIEGYWYPVWKLQWVRCSSLPWNPVIVIFLPAVYFLSCIFYGMSPKREERNLMSCLCLLYAQDLKVYGFSSQAFNSSCRMWATHILSSTHHVSVCAHTQNEHTHAWLSKDNVLRHACFVIINIVSIGEISNPCG